ncbi:MAG: hypothetical protein JST40_10955 [Armatimonadetes bacterium]|nr:hypothetical protein [Armatimonadota bacterium]
MNSDQPKRQSTRLETIASLALALLSLLWWIRYVLVVQPSGAWLRDTDTATALRAIIQRNDPLSWFWTDWPLQNHFYRPISTLTFEYDLRVYGGHPIGFAITNALLVAACFVLVVAIALRMGSRPWSAVLAGLFLLYKLDPFGGPWLGWLALVVIPVAVGIRVRKAPVTLLAILGALFIHFDMSQTPSLASRMLMWVPGRTASTMAVFALLSVWFGLDWVRRNTRWAPIGTVLAAAFAMGSYEQAVMLPAILSGTAILGWLWGARPRLSLVLGPWLLLAAYFGLKHQVIPPESSTYIGQQMRSHGASWTEILAYLFPGLLSMQSAWIMVSTGPLLLLTTGPWSHLASFAANVSTMGLAGRTRLWRPIVFSFAASVLAYLPMAWVKMFEHYHFWPICFRSIFWALLVEALLTLGKERA